MILKSFELNKLKLENYNFYLFYGDNEGLKEDTIKKFFVKKYQNKIHKYEEKEILDNVDDFYNNIFTKSFFDNEKLIVINRVSDKIREIIEELIEKKIEDIQFILNSKNLEKKSNLRKLFEKEKFSIFCNSLFKFFLSPLLLSIKILINCCEIGIFLSLKNWLIIAFSV